MWGHITYELKTSDPPLNANARLRDGQHNKQDAPMTLDHHPRAARAFRGFRNARGPRRRGGPPAAPTPRARPMRTPTTSPRRHGQGRIIMLVSYFL